MNWWRFNLLAPTPDRFAQSITRRLLTRDGVASIEYDRENFVLRITDSEGKASQSNLGNFYAEVIAVPPWKRSAIINRWLDILGAHERGAAAQGGEVRGRLMINVKDPLYFEEVASHGLAADVLVTRPLGAALTQVLVEDGEDRISTVKRETLAANKLTPDEAFAVARENMWKRSNEEFEEVRPGLFISPWHDNYDSSRIVLHDLIWQLKVKGPHAVMIPNRDLLLVTGLDDVAGLTAMGAFATKVLLEQPRPNTGYLYRLEGTSWVVHTPPRDHPAFEKIHDASVVGRAVKYESQRKRLQKAHQDAGRDVFVAGFSVLQDKTSGAMSCYSVWADGEGILPEVDELHLIDMREKARPRGARVRWDNAMAHFRDYMTPVADSYPPRWSVTKLPLDDAVAAAGGEWRSIK